MTANFEKRELSREKLYGDFEETWREIAVISSEGFRGDGGMEGNRIVLIKKKNHLL